MNKSHLLGGGLTLLASLLLAACNNNDDDNAATPTVVQTTQVTVTPSLGKILNAKVTLKNAKTGATLGTGNTDNTGIATFTATKTSDPVVVEVQGSSTATYYDEKSANNLPLTAAKTIRALAPTLTDNANIGVTVLTELATQAAEKNAKGLANVSAQIVNEANTQIKNLLAKELGTASLLTPPTIIGKDTIIANTIKARTAANDYAIKLAALANLGTGDMPVLDMLQKFSDDLSDNKLDGMKGTTDIDYSTGKTNDITDAIDEYLANWVEFAKINSVYTEQILNGFEVIEGNIVITLNNTGSSGGSSASGNYNLTVKTDVSGLGSLPIPTVTIQNVPKPDTQSAFCNDSGVKDALPDGAITITGCSFSGNTGTISLQLNQGILLNYTVTYTYTPA